MTKSIKEERIRWIKPIIDRGIKLVDIVKICPYSERSLKRWLRAYREHGEEGLIPKSTRPNTQPKETLIRVKERIIELRKKEGLCALKLSWRLEKEGIHIHERTIGKILKTERLVRK